MNIRKQIKEARSHVEDAFRRDVMLEKTVILDCLDIAERLRSALEEINNIPTYVQSKRDKAIDKLHKATNIAKQALKQSEKE